ncbi:MAG: hypothetical protein Q4P09_04625 [Phascolarctobacterium sp.]|nr:hypothetical protein [Phascolarctobacterium sp.]
MEDMKAMKDKVNEASIQVYKKDYSEEPFFVKLLKYAKVIGVNGVGYTDDALVVALLF